MERGAGYFCFFVRYFLFNSPEVKVKLQQVIVGFGYDSFTKICAGRKCTAAHIIKIHGGQRTTSSWGQKCKSLKNIVFPVTVRKLPF